MKTTTYSWILLILIYGAVSLCPGVSAGEESSSGDAALSSSVNNAHEINKGADSATTRDSTKKEDTKTPVSDEPRFELSAWPGKALLVVIRPRNLFAEKTAQAFGGKKWDFVDAGADFIAFEVDTGTLALFAQTATEMPHSTTLKDEQVYYIYDPQDAVSLRDLGNFLRDAHNFDGALAAYRQAAKRDTALTDFYHHYLATAIGRAGTAELLEISNRIIALGIANAGTYYGLGIVYRTMKDNGRAIENFTMALDLDPAHADAMIALADIQAKTGHAAQAIPLFEKAIGLNPSSPDEFKTLADLYVRQGDTVKAMESYRKFLDNGGTNSTLAQKVGMYDLRNKDFGKAETYLSMVEGDVGQTADHIYALGELYFNTGRHEDAAARLAEALGKNLSADKKTQGARMMVAVYEKSNDHATALLWLKKYASWASTPDANVLYKLGFYQEETNRAPAIRQYQKNIAQFPGDYRNYLRLGLLYATDKSTLANSAPMLKKAEELSEGMSDEWLDIAGVYRNLGSTENELSAYMQYLSIKPDHAESHARVGRILIDKGNYKEGIESLEKAYEKMPDDSGIQISLAKGYYRVGKNDEAADVLRTAKAARPQDPDILRGLIAVYIKAGENQKALTEIEELMPIQRDNRTLRTYADLLRKEGKLAEAANAIEDILATDPEDLDALMLFGKILRQQKEYDRAIGVYREILLIDKSYAAALYESAEAYREQNKPRWAKEFYTRALKVDPRMGLAELGLAGIAELYGKKDDYELHVAKAYELDPQNPAIKAAYDKIR